MLVAAVSRFFERHPLGPSRIVVACSGGADSTALLLALAEMRRDVFCAHVNHHLRGNESDADERFVRELCARLDVPIVVCDGTIDAAAIKSSGLEAAARDVRIAKLQEVRANSGYIATAHQKNDQAETIVMRLITGTGIAGLRGIHEVRDDGFIRPLIDVTRDEIEEYLKAKNITPRVDHMNDDPRFLRNRVRKALKDFGPAAIDNIAIIATQAQQLWPAIEDALKDADRQHADIQPDATNFKSWPEDPWLKRALLLRHIQRLDPNSREISSKDLERLTTQDIKRVTVTKNLELIKRNDALTLRKRPTKTAAFERELRPGERVYIKEINATIEINPSTRQPVNPSTFTVRNRRPADRYKHKKLKDLLIDRKIPAEERDRLAVVVMGGEILWVAGLDDTNRFKVTSPAGEMFEVKLEHGSREDQDRVQH